MSRSTLLVAVGAVLGGVGVLMTALAAAFEPLLFFVALPFGVAGYLIWYQGTGRLAARARRKARSRDGAERARRAAAAPGAGSREDGPRWADPDAAERRADARRRAARAGAGVASDGGARFAGRGGQGSQFGGRGVGAGDRGPTAPPFEDRMSDREARDVLDVELGSDEEAVRQAYRRKVKETHPDTEDGDEESFKRVAEAYERLADD